MAKLVIDPKNTKALLLDLDGNLVNSEPLHFESWVRTFKEQGAGYVGFEEHLRMYTSMSRNDIIAQEVTRQSVEIDEEQAFNYRREIFMKVVEEIGVQPMKNATSFLKRAKKVGLKLALVTSSKPPEVDAMLKLSNLPKLFDCVITYDDVENTKPDPAAYLLAMKKVGVKKDESLAFEDGKNGIVAVTRAGIKCVVTQKYYPDEYYDSVSGDLVFIDNFNQVAFNR